MGPSFTSISSYECTMDAPRGGPVKGRSRSCRREDWCVACVSIGSTVEPLGKGVGERGNSILLFSWILAGEELWFVFRYRKKMMICEMSLVLDLYLQQGQPVCYELEVQKNHPQLLVV